MGRGSLKLGNEGLPRGKGGRLAFILMSCFSVGGPCQLVEPLALPAPCQAQLLPQRPGHQHAPLLLCLGEDPLRGGEQRYQWKGLGEWKRARTEGLGGHAHNGVSVGETWGAGCPTIWKSWGPRGSKQALQDTCPSKLVQGSKTVLIRKVPQVDKDPTDDQEITTRTLLIFRR